MKIWSYWEGDNNSLLDICLDSWKKYLPDWDIIILNEETVDNYNIIKPENFNSLSQTIKSDVVRLSLLYNYGGLWLDRTVLINEKTDWLKKFMEYDYFGFKLKNKKYIENWFLLVPEKNNKYIKLWLDTFLDIIITNPVTYHPAYDHIYVSDPNYYMTYQAFCYLLDTNEEFKEKYSNMKFISGNGFFYSPFHSIKNQPYLVTKFSKPSRNMYYNFPYPSLYILLLLIAVTIIFFTLRKSKIF